MSLYSTIASNAKKYIAEYGEDVLFQFTPPDGDYDPDTQTVPTDTPISFTTKGVPSNYKFQEIDGVTVLSTDTKLVVAPTTIEVQIGFTATLDSTEFRVMSVRKVRFQGQTPVLIMQLRI